VVGERKVHHCLRPLLGSTIDLARMFAHSRAAAAGEEGRREAPWYLQVDGYRSPLC
jgi:hypothetical protein